MIADTIDSDTIERTPGSEIALRDPHFTQGHLYDRHHFRQILDAYKKETQDASVDAIPWERLIGFRNDIVDFNHIDPEVLHFIDPLIDDATLDEVTLGRLDVYSDYAALPFEPETVERLRDMNITFYSPKVIGKLNVIGAHRKLSYTFAYDLSNQKVSEIAISD